MEASEGVTSLVTGISNDCKTSSCRSSAFFFFKELYSLFFSLAVPKYLTEASHGRKGVFSPPVSGHIPSYQERHHGIARGNFPYCISIRDLRKMDAGAQVAFCIL